MTCVQYASYDPCSTENRGERFSSSLANSFAHGAHTSRGQPSLASPMADSRRGGTADLPTYLHPLWQPLARELPSTYLRKASVQSHVARKKTKRSRGSVARTPRTIPKFRRLKSRDAARPFDPMPPLLRPPGTGTFRLRARPGSARASVSNSPQYVFVLAPLAQLAPFLSHDVPSQSHTPLNTANDTTGSILSCPKSRRDAVIRTCGTKERASSGPTAVRRDRSERPGHHGMALICTLSRI